MNLPSFSRLSAFFFLLFLGLQPLLSFAQQTIRGQVLDARTRTPLPGVSVYVQQGIGIATDPDGLFSLQITDPEARLLYFSLLGYTTRTLPIRPGGSPLTVLLQPDDLQLGVVVVTGYESNRPLLETPASVGLLSARDLSRFNQTSFVSAFNMLPGVRMDERATASYRISIRGSTLRAPYGVRNVKVYLNEIPFTNASGDTPLNLLDVASFGRVEVIKGPAGSVYGAGTGGAVLLKTARPSPGESGAEVSAMAGSYGLRRYTATLGTSTKDGSLLLQYANQQQNGYREQSAMDRKTLTLSGQFQPSEKRTLSLHGFYSDLYYELPGGLTRAQYEANPRQARPDVVNAQGVVVNRGSVTQNASMQVEALNLGVAQEYRFSDRLANTTALYGTFTNMDHPFVTDYERNSDQGLGGRTRTTYSTHLGTFATKFTVGGEYQRSFEVARSFFNNEGQLGALRFDDEIRAEQGIIFGQVETELPGQVIATLGASHNTLRYTFTRVFDDTGTGTGSQTRSFDPVLSPRIALLKRLTPNLTVHGSVGAGFSPPSQDEIRTSDGVFHTGLQAEKGTNYELGFRGNVLGQRLSFDVTAFSLHLRETIVGSTQASTVVTFTNSGATRQNGVETALSYYVVQAPERPLSLVKVWGSYAYNKFWYLEHQPDGENFSGNPLPGVAPHTLTSGLDLESRHGLYLNATSNYVDQIPLNDRNTVFADAYLIFGARGGWRTTLFRHLQTELFAGVDNLTDRRYSLGNDLNVQFGNRFYQPAPGRNYYCGVTARYLF